MGIQGGIGVGTEVSLEKSLGLPEGILSLQLTKEGNYKTILELSDEQFAVYYLEKMREYDWWEKGIKPNCQACHQTIERPEDLRRYYGQNLHPLCIRKVYEEDGCTRIYPEVLQQYWKRVLELDLKS